MIIRKSGSDVDKDNLENILNLVKVSLDHPLFYSRVFTLIAKQDSSLLLSNSDEIVHVATEQYEELSRRLDRSGIQESISVRNVLRTRKLAQLLIDEKGEVNHLVLPKLIAHLEAHLYSLGPDRQYDGVRQKQILNALKFLVNDKEIIGLIRKITRPLSNPNAEELIRQTLQLAPGTILNDVHTKQAVLSAWLCYLRQNVGSCFATAPAEMIHDEQPELFLQDLIDLIATERLKRTFGGIEHSVPLSMSWGSGDLKKPLIIRFSSKGVSPEIWFSPGLIKAFEAAELLKIDDGVYFK